MFLTQSFFTVKEFVYILYAVCGDLQKEFDILRTKELDIFRTISFFPFLGHLLNVIFVFGYF